MMNVLRCILFSFLVAVSCSSPIEIDIDRLTNSTNAVLITVDHKIYGCSPKTPPLSHSWSYECETFD